MPVTTRELEDLRDAMIRANDAARLRPGDPNLERRAIAATRAYEGTRKAYLSRQES